MVEFSTSPERLDAVFSALADATRRALVLELSHGERSIGELGAPFDVSFQAISKHVQVLERAGLVQRRKVGRTHLCRLSAAPLASADHWLKHYEKLWNERFDALDALLKAEAGDASPTPRRVSHTAKRKPHQEDTPE